MKMVEFSMVEEELIFPHFPIKKGRTWSG